LQGKALQDFVIDKIDDLKGQDIIAIDVKGKSSITDCMIICTGTSTRHVVSIADHVVQESRAAGCCRWALKVKRPLTGWLSTSAM
jgi:ribosome-associated protein